ncbi:MAG TPA: 1-deoxy-D-xylulose-5-phosphate reductoisomerase [Epulopiscium sp.]|nr:1-deoxy-D-xylulose-5-phosphate reductoisomerase [Candidatus Epulonipiscium sp.]
MAKIISILGSTGSVGTQTLEVVSNMGNISVRGLTTNVNIDLLEKQINIFKPIKVAVMNEPKAIELQKRLRSKGIEVEVLSGIEGLTQIATLPEVDTVVTSVVGMIGLIPTIRAIESGKDIALANKETLVTAGQIVMEKAKEKGVAIYPVDSEHSAIFQCLRGNENEPIHRIILTASGGPFRSKSIEDLHHVTVEDALKHPNWDMGKKISIDSATMMNKGLEVIEAKWLFNVALEQIDVIVHPQSIIHSMVEFEDTTIMAQLSSPDMKGPIQYALNYPDRKVSNIERVNFTTYNALTFEEPDHIKFPCLEYAFKAMKIGGTMPAVLNAANEIAVEAFLNRAISFMDIPKLIHDTMEAHICINKPSLTQILESDQWAREFSREKVDAWK